jgi:hypothetical protein
MKIHGGKLDLGEKDMSSFPLGLNFKTSGYEKKKELRARKFTLIVRRCENICRN